MGDYNEKERKLLYIGLCLFAASFVIVTLIASNVNHFSDESSFISFIFIGFGMTLFFLLTPVWVKIMYNKRIEEEYRQQQEEERRQAEERRREWENIVRSGQWEFPVEEFYEVCESENITSLDNAIFLKKAMTYAEDFLWDDVILKYKDIYLTEEKVKEYFKQGRAAKEGAYVTPQTGMLDAVKSSNYELFESFVRCKKGFEKRNAWLNEEIGKLQKRINEIEEGRRALNTLSLAIVNSAYQKPTTDWATMGGIASGLAGPAAGLAVANNIMAENAKIEAENAINQACVNNMAMDFSKKAAELSTYDLEKPKRIFEQEKGEIHYKVVLDGTNKRTLFNSLKITSRCVKVDNSTEVKVTFENSYIPDAPETVKMVTDGTLNAKIFCDDIFVDEICVPLPMFGVRCKNEEKIEMTVYSPKYMLGTSRNYRIEFTPNNLYVIER